MKIKLLNTDVTKHYVFILVQYAAQSPKVKRWSEGSWGSVNLLIKLQCIWQTCCIYIQTYIGSMGY